MDLFKKQANQYNFDRNKYLSTIKKVPVVSETKVKEIKSQKQRLTNIIEGSDVCAWEWNVQT
jgi:hypothetical protein